MDALLLKPLLRVRVVGRDGGRQDRRHHERQDVQAVQEDLLDGALTVTTTTMIYFPIQEEGTRITISFSSVAAKKF